MQGFNRYVPPDFDPRAASTLNAHQGKKHALGKRAKDIDKGILIVRFELPYNIWCGHCNAHIGAGVRYNAQKKKVGNYYSTPIYGFRCKCHLCDGWFEIRTDPQNAAYVVHEGAKKKDEDWNPEENGGFAIHDTEAPSAADAPADPFAHIEKTIDQQTWVKSKKARLTELQDSADRLSSDPYVVSSALRRKFREEKKVMLEKQGRDDGLKEKYGLHDGVELGEEDVEKSRAIWEAGRERAGLPIDDTSATDSAESSVRGVVGTPRPRGKERIGGNVDLASVLRKTTAKKYDPFADAVDSLFSSTPERLKVKGKTKDIKASTSTATSARKEEKPAVLPFALGGGLLAGYASD